MTQIRTIIDLKPSDETTQKHQIQNEIRIVCIREIETKREKENQEKVEHVVLITKHLF